MSWIISVIFAGLLTANAGEIPSTPIINNNAVVQSTTAMPEPNNGDVIEEKFEQNYALDANGRVSLSNVNGGVTIDAWEKAEARVSAVKRINCERPLDLQIKVDSSASELRIETVYPNSTWTWNGGKHSSSSSSSSTGYQNRCRELSVEYRLTLPRGARLDQIETVNGGVSLTGMTDAVKVATVNGKITAANLRGTVNLSSVNGTLDADFDALDNVREIKLDIINGTLNLTLPSDADATFKADTINGSIASDFGFVVRKGEYVGRDMHSKLGGGNLPVKLSSINGAINVRRKNDGRQIKTVTNLLSAQNENSGFAPKPPPKPRPMHNPAPLPPNGEFFDEETREEIKKSVAEATKNAREYAAIAKIDAEKIRREVQAEMEQVRRETANLNREFAYEFGSPRFPATTRQTDSFTVEGAPKITVEAENGAISVRGWDKSEVSYALVRRSDDAMQFEVKKDNKNLNIKAASNGGEDYKIELFVPRNSDLKIKTNKQIRVEGVTGELKLDGDEQSIDVRDGGGNLSAATSCGRLRVIGFDGALTAQTIDGDIALEGNFTALTIDNMNGTTALTVNKNAAAQIAAPFDRVTFDAGINVFPTDAKVQRIGSKTAAQNDGKFTLKTIGGQIYIRNADNVKILRNQRTVKIRAAV